MPVRCPTCRGKGRVPDMSFTGPMSYYNPKTGESWPHETCRTCCGEGWIEDGKIGFPADGGLPDGPQKPGGLDA